MQNQRKNTLSENSASTTNDMLDNLENLLRRPTNLPPLDNIPIQELELEEESKNVTPPVTPSPSPKVINVRGNNNVVIGNQSLNHTTQNFFRAPSPDSQQYALYAAHIDVDNPQNSHQGTPTLYHNYFNSPSKHYLRQIAQLKRQLKEKEMEDRKDQICNMRCNIL